MTQRVEARPVRYTQKEMALHFVKGFAFARGAVNSTYGYLQFLAATYRNRLSERRVRAAVPLAQIMITNYIGSSSEHPKLHRLFPNIKPADVINEELTMYSRFLIKQLREPTGMVGEADLFDVRSMLDTDKRWIPYAGFTFDNAEPDSPYEGSNRPRHYRSSFIHHGLLSRTTHCEELDAYYDAVVKQYTVMSQSMKLQGETTEKIQVIAAAHLAYNEPDASQLLKLYK